MAGPKATFDADFGQFVSELTKIDIKLKEFQPSADRASARLQRMADSLNGNKILEQAAIAVNAINRIDGGVKALNNGELRRYGTLVDAATEKLTRMGRDVPPALAQVKAALDQARKPLDDINKSAGEAGGALGGLAGAIGQGLGIGAGIGAFDLVTNAVGGLKNAIGETITEGNRLSQLRTAFTNLQGGAGPATVALGELRDATRGLVADVDLLAAANKASLLGLGEMGIKTDELASIAVRLGKAMGQDAAKSVDDLTTALARQSPQILDNLGIKVDLTAANEKYAAGLGKTVDALTEEERKMAFAGAAMDAARAKAETLGEQKLTLTEQIGRVSTALDNMQAGLGSAANESGILAAVAGRLADNMNAVTEASADLLAEYNRLVAQEEGFTVSTNAAAAAVELALLPPLAILNATLDGTADSARRAKSDLEAFAAVRAFVRGELDVFDTPTLPGAGKRGDIQLGGSFGQNQRARDVLAADQKRLTDEYIKQQEEQLRRIEQNTQKGDRKLDQLIQARTERLNRLLGRDALQEAQRTIADVFGKGGVGLGALDDATVAATFEKLSDAREIARRIEPGAVQGLTTALDRLAKHPAIAQATRDAGRRIFEKMLGPDAVRATASSLAGQSGRELLDAIFGTPGDFLPTNNPLNTVLSLAPTVESSLGKVKKQTDDWRVSLQNVSQAFANLSQVMGGSLDRATTAIGGIFAAANAGKELVKSLGELFGNSDFAQSPTGRGLAGGLAGFATGSQLGAMVGQSGWGAFLAGAGGGAASGGLAGGWAGAGVGLVVGGVGALLAAQEEEATRRELMRQNRNELLAQFESREDLIEQARRVGISEREINEFILQNTSDTEGYARTANALSAAFQREQRQAEALSKSLGAVAKVNGVLSRQQFTDLRAALYNPGSLLPADPDGLRPRNPGIPSPTETVIEGEGPRGGPRSEAAEAFLRQQGQSLLAGLGRILEQPGALTPSLVKAVGQSLPAALEELERQGMSSIDALRTLQPLLEEFQQKAVLAGAGSTPGFDALNAQLAILKDERLGPLIERANGSGQALGALQNLGLLTQETFDGFAGSITETVAGMDLLSDQGQNAMRLIRQPLQNIWQLQQDFGYEVDASTQALLDQAQAAGLIGDKFRPVEERMLAGIDAIVDRLDRLLDVFTEDMPNAGRDGAERTAGFIRGEFEKLKPVVKIRYDQRDLPADPDRRVTYPEDPSRNDPPWVPPTGPVEPGTRHPATAGFDAARAAASASTSRAAVYIDGREAGYAILPHLGGLLEFHNA